MTAINHAMTGVLIGLTVITPTLALPLALVSHYICDIIPHYKLDMPSNKLIKTNWFRNYLVLEVIACGILVTLLALLKPHNWLLAIVCAFIAASPDLLSINRFRQVRRGYKWRPNAYTRVAMGIQWFERPIGGFVELAWFIATLALILPFLVG